MERMEPNLQPLDCKCNNVTITSRACERSGKRSGATRKSGGAERSGERAWEKNDGAERNAEREVAERERSVERAELAAHSPLQRNISLIS